MAASALEHTTDSKEAEITSQGNRSVQPGPQAVSETERELTERASNGLPLPPPSREAAQLFRSKAMSHPVNSSVRFATIQRAQRTHGNRFVQRLTNRLQPAAAARNYIQRHCTCGGTCEECRKTATDSSPIVQLGSAESGRLIQTQSSTSAGSANPPALDAEVIPANSEGKPLDEASRQFMEPRFGVEFRDVRVHTDNAAQRSANDLQANAYTSGNDIYFAAGNYAPKTSEGRRLLAHELTHTQQQKNGRISAATSREEGVLVGSETDPLEQEAERVGENIEQGTGDIPRISKDATPAVRRDVSSVIGDIWDATGGRVVSGVSEIWDAAKETAAAFIERLAPGVLQLLRNAGTFLYDKITSGIDHLFGGIASRVQKQGVIGAISGIFSEVAASLGKSIGQLAAGSCHSIVEAASSIIHFVKETAGETFAELGHIAKAVGDFFSEIWNDFGAPALDAIQKVAGEAWNWIKEKAQWLWDKLLPIRNTVGAAWDWLKKEFNIAKEEGAGLLDWLYDKAKDQWMKVREKIAPILGPLKIVAGALLLLSPLGPIIAIWKGAPYLWQALQWIWANGIKPASAKIREEFREHILPHILQGIDAITAKLDEAAAFLCGHASEISAGLHALEDALAGFSLLKLASRMVGFVAGFFDGLATKGKCKFSDVVAEAKSVLRQVYQFVKPVLEVLRQAALIATLGPWAILDDGVWKTLNQFVAFAKRTPCIREIAGLLHVDGIMEKVGEIRATLKDIWQVVSNQEKFEAEIHKAVDGMLAQIPSQAETVLGTIIGLDGPHLDTLMKRFLAPKLVKVVASAPQMLIDMAWGLIWPWPGVSKECEEIEKQVDKLKSSLWDFEFSKAIDAGLAIWRGVNGVIGLLYGWFFIAAVLIGAVFGAPQAGAAIAYEVGEALLLSTVVAEGLTIDKAKFNLMSPSRLAKPQAERQKEDDEDYETITGSVVNLAILAALAVLSEIAVDFAKAVFAEIKGVFLPEGAEAPKVEVPTKTAEPIKEAEPVTKDTAAKPSEPATELSKDTAAKAEENAIPREQLEAEVGDLRQKASNPDNVRKPADSRFDAEMDTEGHTFDRNKTDKSWCRRSVEVCGLDLGSDVNTKVDTALEKKAPEPTTPEPSEPLEKAATTKEIYSTIRQEIQDLTRQLVDLKKEQATAPTPERAKAIEAVKAELKDLFKEAERYGEKLRTEEKQAEGRVPEDQAVDPEPPEAQETGDIGQSPAQKAELQKDIQEAKALGARDIRVNQQQVNAQLERVGINRPDLQYTLPDGTRVYIEYDSPTSGRGPGHKSRILANDPGARVILKEVTDQTGAVRIVN